MPQLTEAGMSAMAVELFRLATGGQKGWDQASTDLQQKFRGLVDSMIDRARDAEESASPHEVSTGGLSRF